MACETDAGPIGCPAVGDTCPGGDIYAGTSSGGDTFFFVPAIDAPQTMTWDQAMSYADALNAQSAHGHEDWRLPTKPELEVLYQNQAKGTLAGTFDESGSGPSGWYWSATVDPDFPDGAWMERFSDGYRDRYWKYNDVSVRPIRSEPRP